ncbi:MAG: amidohydrolase family protein [Candidatus Heimdallarchaeota archaeon]|nr:amidohydrolase family protein [Candidatus Heimdallarchaeota archaeon]
MEGVFSLTVDIKLINGLIFFSGEFIEGGLAIEGERIIKIGKDPNLPRASETINTMGGLIIPGVIDIHVHFRDFQQKYKETLETGTRAAIAGGVTSVIEMPNNKPPTDSVWRIKAKKQLIEGKAAGNIGFYSLIPPEKQEIIKLVKEGIFGYKIYPESELYPPKQQELFIKMAETIAETKLPLLIHPDHPFASEREKESFESNLPSIEAFLKAHPAKAEGNALKKFIQLNEKIMGQLHCCHITAQETIEVLRRNKKHMNLTGEVCPHHLLLNEEDLYKFKSEAKCLPPLRSKKDQQALWEAVRDGTIRVIASDHAPHSFKEKHTNFIDAACGISGVETTLQLMITAALKGFIAVEKMIPLLTKNPANLLKLTERGELKEGNYADVVVLQKEKKKIDPEKFESKAKWSPFAGFETQVTPQKVIVNGHLVKDGEYVLSRVREGKILTQSYNSSNNHEREE